MTDSPVDNHVSSVDNTIPPVDSVNPEDVVVIELEDAMTPPPTPQSDFEDSLREPPRWSEPQPVLIDDRNHHVFPAFGVNLPAPKCFAFSRDGRRCELDAGHTEDHEVRFAWGDDECWVPGNEITTPPEARMIAPGVWQQPIDMSQQAAPAPAAEEPVLSHVTKDGTPVLISTDVPPADPQDPNEKCAVCVHPYRNHANGAKCACGQCPRFIPGASVD